MPRPVWKRKKGKGNGILSSSLTSVNFWTTILNLRSYYLSLKTIPLFPWSLLITGGMLLLTLPILSGALLMVLADLHSNTLFFDPIFGGDPIFYLSLFSFSCARTGLYYNSSSRQNLIHSPTVDIICILMEREQDSICRTCISFYLLGINSLGIRQKNRKKNKRIHNFYKSSKIK